MQADSQTTRARTCGTKYRGRAILRLHVADQTTVSDHRGECILPIYFYGPADILSGLIAAWRS